MRKFRKNIDILQEKKKKKIKVLMFNFLRLNMEKNFKIQNFMKTQIRKKKKNCLD